MKISTKKYLVAALISVIVIIAIGLLIYSSLPKVIVTIAHEDGNNFTSQFMTSSSVQDSFDSPVSTITYFFSPSVSDVTVSVNTFNGTNIETEHPIGSMNGTATITADHLQNIVANYGYKGYGTYQLLIYSPSLHITLTWTFNNNSNGINDVFRALPPP